MNSKVYALLMCHYSHFKDSAMGTGMKVMYLQTDMVLHLLWELLICSIQSENTIKWMFINCKE